MSADFVRYNLFCCELWQKVSFYIKWEQENNVKPLASVRRVADQRGRNLWLAGSNDPFLWLAGTNDPFLWLARAIEWSTTTRMAFNCNEVRFKNIIIRSRVADPAASTVHGWPQLRINCHQQYRYRKLPAPVLFHPKIQSTPWISLPPGTVTRFHIEIIIIRQFMFKTFVITASFYKSSKKMSFLPLYTLSCPQKTIHSLPGRYQYLFCTYFAQDQQNFIIYKN